MAVFQSLGGNHFIPPGKHSYISLHNDSIQDTITVNSMRPAIFFDLTHTLLEKTNERYHLYSDALDTLKALLERGYRVAFFGGPMDQENVQEILSKMKYKEHPGVGVFTGKINLLELAALARKCAVFLTNDSGPMHVAVSQKVPVVAIFGSSNEVGFGPYSQNSVVVKTDIACRPCGRHHCDHHSCMTEIAHEQVLAQIMPFVSSTSKWNC